RSSRGRPPDRVHGGLVGAGLLACERSARPSAVLPVGRASIPATARRGAGGGPTPPLDGPGLHDTSNQTIGHLHVPAAMATDTTYTLDQFLADTRHTIKDEGHSRGARPDPRPSGEAPP